MLSYGVLELLFSSSWYISTGFFTTNHWPKWRLSLNLKYVNLEFYLVLKNIIYMMILMVVINFSGCSEQDNRVLEIGKLFEYFNWPLQLKCEMGTWHCEPSYCLWLLGEHLSYNPPVSLSLSLSSSSSSFNEWLFYWEWFWVLPWYIYRKIYALDIYGEIPKELFELKKLMDL